MSSAVIRSLRSRGALTPIGAGLILVAGLIHLVLSPEHFREAPYLGLLFLADFLGAAVATFGIYLGHRWGWMLGALIAGGALLAYVVSGTVGLPGVGRGHFLEPVGVLAKMAEALFLVLCAYRFMRFRRLVLVGGIAAVLLVTGAATALGLRGAHAGHAGPEMAGLPVRWAATSPATHLGDQYTLLVKNTGEEDQQARINTIIMDHRTQNNTNVVDERVGLAPGEEREFAAVNDYGTANHFSTRIGSETQDLGLAVKITDAAGEEIARFNQKAFLTWEGRQKAGGKTKGDEGHHTGFAGDGGDPGMGHGGNHDHGDGDRASSTAAEQEAAAKLVSDTEAGAARFEDLEVAQAEGYELMRGKRGNQARLPGRAHFLNKEYVEDGRVLDPEHPEGLMYIKTRDGEMRLIGTMYVAPRGEGPTDGGELTQWHTHDRLCMDSEEETPGVVVSLRRLGGCPEGSSPVSELEMMHVWLFDHPDGPLAQHLKPKDAAVARRTL